MRPVEIVVLVSLVVSHPELATHRTQLNSDDVDAMLIKSILKLPVHEPAVVGKEGISHVSMDDTGGKAGQLVQVIYC